MGKTKMRKPKKGLTFEDVWAMFQETDRLSRENERKSKENEQKSKETWEQLKAQMKETDRKIGELGNRFGELAEHLVGPNITEKFNDLNLHFEHISHNHEIKDSTKRCIAEIDLLLENSDMVMVVEIKSKPLQKDVDDHIKRIEIFRRRANALNDKRIYRGAIAGAIMANSVRNYAHKAGFYVIEQTGDTVKINIPENFTPREW